MDYFGSFVPGISTREIPFRYPSTTSQCSALASQIPSSEAFCLVTLLLGYIHYFHLVAPSMSGEDPLASGRHATLCSKPMTNL